MCCFVHVDQEFSGDLAARVRLWEASGHFRSASRASRQVRDPSSMQILRTDVLTCQQSKFMLDNRAEGHNFSSVANVAASFPPQRPDVTRVRTCMQQQQLPAGHTYTDAHSIIIGVSSLDSHIFHPPCPYLIVHNNATSKTPAAGRLPRSCVELFMHCFAVWTAVLSTVCSI